MGHLLDQADPAPCPRCGEDRLTTLDADARGRQGVYDACAHSWWLRPVRAGTEDRPEPVQAQATA